VRGVTIDYSNYSQTPPQLDGSIKYIVYPDYESQGIRALQGDAIVTINWTLIKTIIIKGMNTDVVPYRYDADITLKDGKSLSLGLKIDSKYGLNGETDLGKYSIDLQSVKSIVVLHSPSSVSPK
jgi:hypothetical protein